MLKIKVEDDYRFAPHHKEGDAAIDLRFDQDNVTLHPGEIVAFDSHVKVILPSGLCGLVLPRSGLATGKLGTIGAKIRPVNVGLIDPSYTGTIKGVLENIGNEPATLNKFDRVAQLLVIHFEIPVNVITEKYERGSTGFGHSGI